MTSQLVRFGWQRALTHTLLFALTVGGCYLTAGYFQAPVWAVHTLTIALGYVALLWTAVSLVIGPLNLLRRRSNPVNIDLRRDVGIWAGITASLHVFFSLVPHFDGSWLYLFVAPNGAGGISFVLNLISTSNYAGLIATVLLVVLTVLSNDLSLRYLKGPRWKRVQRANYLLAILALGHTLGYQIINHRALGFTWAIMAGTMLVMSLQLGGMALYNRRFYRRQPGS